jgi:hypothetical protein
MIKSNLHLALSKTTEQYKEGYTLFKPGDYDFDQTNNERVQIISANEACGFVSYKAYNPVMLAVYKLSAEALSTSTADGSRDEC